MLPPSICIFEDDRFSDFLPLTWFRAVFELRCGFYTMAERIRRLFPEATTYLQCRSELGGIVSERYADCRVNVAPREGCLFINGAVIPDEPFLKQVLADRTLTYTHQGVPVAFWSGLGTRKVEIPCTRLSYVWELLHRNAEQIRQDFHPDESAPLPGHVHVVEPQRIVIGKDVVLKPGVVLDAEQGPIVIADGATIMANAVLEGPCCIGKGSTVKIGAKIYGGTSIGPVCKIGGEVEGSIVQGYSNKQHDGFLGHSYLGEWCNLGADTNTSDLKNNYRTVSVRVNGRDVDTGSLFVGLMMGDHSKSGINTMFNTGTTCGPMCNVFGAGFAPKDIPAFSWVDSGKIGEYNLPKALEVSRTVMRRRGLELTPVYEELIRHVHEETEDERASGTHP